MPPRNATPCASNNDRERQPQGDWFDGAYVDGQTGCFAMFADVCTKSDAPTKCAAAAVISRVVRGSGQTSRVRSGRVGSGATRKILRPPDPTRPNPRDLKSSPPDLTWPVRFQAPPDPTRSDPPDSDLTSEIRVRRGSGHLDLLGFFSRSAGSTQRIRPVGGRFKTK